MAAPSIGVQRFVLLRYFSRELLSRIGLCTIILVALMEILTLLEQTTPILERHLGFAGIMTYAGLRLPLLLDNALPLSALVGALLLLTQLTLSSEIAILRAAGMSTPVLYRTLLPATLFVAALTFVLDDQITPWAEVRLASWWNVTDPTPETAHDFWFRDHDLIINAGYITGAGTTLHKVSIYQRRNDGALVQVKHATQATFNQGHWKLDEVQQITLKGARTIDSTMNLDNDATLPSESWDINLNPRDVVRLSMDAPPLSIASMNLILKGSVPSALPPSYYHTALVNRLSTPFFFLVMVLLALPVVYIPPRTGTRSWLPVWCLGGGLLFIVFQGLLRALSNAGTLPVPLAIVPGIAIFALGIATVLIRMEER